eukprot:Blabericola_migrator_1__3493@NODE_2034_length_3386_cov_73_301898_g1291_i0_p1_GENE_NODE_2034_length_3386_cov_73_301898_g1291_i0NODE_2034_length_3386_cov_73_301898_g1291_i0_p1_ORF_typecomplete_len786_score154_99Methyltr_RsmBF/PF01189_17/1e50FtsJ/PF01728_19/0_0012Amidohydro_1/PF01979_20/0_073Methyltr_RsmF_N/PF17125_5/0_32Methyltr_RsmF_N/PF17125_5/1_5e04DUF3024/PF11225_8/22DUF3024/PF11225_8/42_NODE_2034_length_3386_cov_73_301898_g1291_i04632820
MAVSFSEYYQSLGIVPKEEWDAFEQALRTPLPITFRVLSDTIHTRWVTDFVSQCEKSLADIKDEFVFGPLKWYNQGTAWELKASRQTLRSHARLNELSQFLIKQSENGVIIRQEAVSMIPALFLMSDLKSDDVALLDLCAAPGSKTSQLLEGLEMVKPQNRKDRCLPPRGVVVANDINPTRAHMLCHHLKYQSSPSLIVSLHNAALYPRLFTNDSEGHPTVLKFDGVLCDVPCSGDGTMRKAPRIWKTWDCKGALGLHRVQMRILKKGISMCAVGGRIVYSTCSFNPIENEAVVAGVLRHAEGSVVIESVKLDHLKSRPGLCQWKVVWRSDSQYNTYEEVPENLQHSRIWPSMFPPKEPEIIEAMARCQRYVPHDNDTGGFFVTVLRKVKACPWERGRPRGERAVLGCESDEEEEEAVSPDPEKKMKLDSAVVVVKPFNATVGQKDIIPISQDERIQADVEAQCIKRYGLKPHPELISRLWYRPHIVHTPQDKKKRTGGNKRDCKGKMKSNENPLQMTRDERAGVAETELSAKVASETNTTATTETGTASTGFRDTAASGTTSVSRNADLRVPRRIIITSDRAREVLRATTVKCPHRIAGAGTLYAEIKPTCAGRITQAGFKYGKALLEEADPGFKFNGSGSTVTISKDMMKSILALAQESTCNSLDQSTTPGPSSAPTEVPQDDANESAKLEEPEIGEVAATGEEEKKLPPMMDKHFDNRFKYMDLEEGNEIRELLETLEKETHHLFIVKLDSDALYVPMYVGKRNADILVTDSVRRSIICLLK